MQPNDKAFEAAKKTYNIHSAYDAEYVPLCLAVDAAYAAQFQPSEDYAGLVKELREWAGQCEGITLTGEKIIGQAADAIEALLAERDALKAELAAANTRMSKLDFERTAAELERDALRARLAPANDEALVEIVAGAINDGSKNIARAAITAIRPHIEAAEREQCVKAVEKVAEKINVVHHERPEWEDGYLQGVYDAAAAIRRG